MDIRMPGVDGLEATRRLLDGAGSSAPRIVILTTFDLDEYVYAALQSGASGFLLKDVTPEQLVAAVRTVSVGDALLSPSITRRLVERFARPAAALPGAPEALRSLTARETDVFGLIARGMSNAEIADALVVTEATVKTHVAGILRSSPSATGPRPSCSPTRPGSSEPARRPRRSRLWRPRPGPAGRTNQWFARRTVSGPVVAKSDVKPFSSTRSTDAPTTAVPFFHGATAAVTGTTIVLTVEPSQTAVAPREAARVWPRADRLCPGPGRSSPRRPRDGSTVVSIVSTGLPVEHLEGLGTREGDRHVRDEAWR